MEGCKCSSPTGFNFGSYCFLVYIKDLADGLSSNAKLFEDDTSLFSVIHDVDISLNELNNDIYQSKKWAFQWKWALTQTQASRSEKLFLV